MNNRERTILLAAMLVTLVTGSIHAFSVFLVPLGDLLQLPRADISLFYSFALVFLTISVLLGYLVYALVRPPLMVLLACLGAGAGLLFSAYATGWWTLFFGYSVLFGTANGLGYGYVLQLVGRALPQRKGFAMSAVTAAYATGSVVFSLVLAFLVKRYSLSAAFTAMAFFIVIGGLVSAAAMKVHRVSYGPAPTGTPYATNPGVSIVALLWLAYGSSVFAGLMAIGHAAGIVQSVGGAYGQAIWGAVLIGIGSAMGGFLIGWLIKRENINSYLVGLPLLSALFLGMLTFVELPAVTIIMLSVIGFAYGALIAVYPFAISVYFGDALAPKVYGRVFTAWGFAGLAGPWSAGKLFDQAGSYSMALIIASMIAVVSSLICLYWPRRLDPGL